MAPTKAWPRKGESHGKKKNEHERKRKTAAIAQNSKKPPSPSVKGAPTRNQKQQGQTSGEATQNNNAKGHIKGVEKKDVEGSSNQPARQGVAKRALEAESPHIPSKVKKLKTSSSGSHQKLSTGKDEGVVEEPLADTEDGVDLTVLENLASSYSVTDINIISSSKIEQKVKRILETLSSFTFAAGPAKPNIILLHAKSKVAVKLISVVEIAKREIATTGGKYYQYNRLDSTMVERERKSVTTDADFTILGRKVEADPDAMEEDEATLEDEGTFETMKLPHERAVEGKPIKRAIPGMTIFLSRVRVESLKRLYGEQTNELTAKLNDLRVA